MRAFCFISLLTAILTLSCSCTNYSDNYKVNINRFDIDLRYSLDNYSNDSIRYLASEKHPKFFSVYSNGVLKLREDSTKEYIIEELHKRYNNVRFNRLYSDTEAKFNDLSTIEDTLSIAFSNLSDYIPNLKPPKIYSHISGFAESIITTDSIISISLDNYLGEDYEGYKIAFYNYMHKYKTPNNISKDIIRGYLYLKFPQSRSEITVAEGMIYEGAILYLLQQANPKWSIAQLLNYNNSDIAWCKDNIEAAKEYMIKSNHLLSTDALIYQKYIAVSPYNSYFGIDSPSQLGRYIGYSMVNDFMKNRAKGDIIKILNREIDSKDIIKKFGL